MTIAVHPRLRSTRRVLLGFGIAGLVSACARGPALIETIDDVPYVPVDPAKAARLINAYRAESNAGALELDADLVRIAGDYAHRLAEAGRMNHALAPYGGLDQRLKAAGYAYATAGENLGQGYRTIEQTITGWKHSPAHDRGMKDAEMTRMGIASAENPKKRGDVYWCLIVAEPRPAGAPAGSGPFAPTGGTRVSGSLFPFLR
ncbi:CAP domain-containing protein [Pinisolibacter sp.]|uniref:CAP domain-containing protein n=1 Tax=Pinisolibacter sp. TaxID=2172024 RepID=UPI002FDD33DE